MHFPIKLQNNILSPKLKNAFNFPESKTEFSTKNEFFHQNHKYVSFPPKPRKYTITPKPQNIFLAKLQRHFLQPNQKNTFSHQNDEYTLFAKRQNTFLRQNHKNVFSFQNYENILSCKNIFFVKTAKKDIIWQKHKNIFFPLNSQNPFSL